MYTHMYTYNKQSRLQSSVLGSFHDFCASRRRRRTLLRSFFQTVQYIPVFARDLYSANQEPVQTPSGAALGTPLIVQLMWAISPLSSMGAKTCTSGSGTWPTELL